MCGIVGCIGSSQAKDVVLEGLKKMEYRGYDSSGIAIINDKLRVYKKAGRLENLLEEIKDKPMDTSIAIGHTRWATHGEPSDFNAHPHTNEAKTIAVVHNGIVENFVSLREMLIKEAGVHFVTDTDTEVIAHLIGYLYEGDIQQAVWRAVEMMDGAYAIAAIANDNPDILVAYRKDAPLVAGFNDTGSFVASDIPALLKQTKDFYLIENDEMVVCKKDGITIYNSEHKKVDREIFHVDWDTEAAEKGGHPHFMIKEILEQPKAISETLSRRLTDDNKINLDGISLSLEDIEGFTKIYIVACGTAYHAGLVGKYIIEKFAKVPVEVDVASEFRYRDPYIDDKTLFIAISQSGETLDTLAALREAKSKGARVLSIVNVVGSSVARESHDVFYTWAGPEIAVASTKAYTTQLVCLYLIALYMGRLKGTMNEAYYIEIIDELKKIPDKIDELLESRDSIHDLANEIKDRNSFFFVGRGLDAAVAYEASLKLKEISYINSFAIAAGELKHGTIALMEEGTVVVALATQDFLFDKMLSNIEEIKARNASVLTVAKNDSNAKNYGDMHIMVPVAKDEVMPLISVVPMQLLSYYVAAERGENIDQPRNLAKSVTVE